MTDPIEIITAAIEAGEPIGWQILDPEGNVIDSGGISFAQLTTDGAEKFGLDIAQEG